MTNLPEKVSAVRVRENNSGNLSAPIPITVESSNVIYHSTTEPGADGKAVESVLDTILAWNEIEEEDIDKLFQKGDEVE